MFRSIANMPIFRRLFLAFALAAVIPSIVIAVLGANYINALTIRGQAIQTSNDAVKITTTQQTNLQQMHTDLIALNSETATNASIGGNDQTITSMIKSLNDEILRLQNEFSQAAQSYQQNYQINTSPGMAEIRNILQTNDPGNSMANQQQTILSAVIAQQWTDYQTAQTNELTALKHTPFDQKNAYQLLVTATNKFTPLKKNWAHLVDLSEQIGITIATVSASDTNPILEGTAVAILLTLLVVITIGYIVNLTITRPLRQLATLTRRIAKGETSARARLAGRDEIYMVATSMNNMLDNIVRLIQETQSQRDNLQAQVEKLVSEVSGVGEGDLRVQAEVTADALGVLADSFNYMVEELGSLVVRVKMVAGEVENFTTATLDRMTQLVETGDMQIDRIAQAAFEVEHMAESSRNVADRAQVLYRVSYEARQEAQTGRETVQQAVEGMGRINENVQATSNKVQVLGDRSREINEIVNVISSIAHQTNRLALDAAIQAAMAGENGKGFGAVAADIRRLAEQAKDQASSITRIVRSVSEDIGAAAISMQDTERETGVGKQLIQEVGIALESIFSDVEEQAREIENINQMAAQQLQSSSAVVQIMHGLSDSTQRSSLSTREASQNMERLARLVEQLRASVEAFKLRDNQGYYVPNAQMNISQEVNDDGQMTVSGIFRTVSASIMPAGAGKQNALPPARPNTNDAFAPYPAFAGGQNQQGNGWGQQQYPGGAFDEYGNNNGYPRR